MKCFVTGGAGFIGSHATERLLADGNEVVVFDNLVSGNDSYLKNCKDNPRFSFVRGDMMDDTIKDAMIGSDQVWHLGANPLVKDGNMDSHFKHNVLTTYNVLKCAADCKVKSIIFASTSTVYGDADEIPTRENYGPLLPISSYGASKLACESIITGFCELYGMSGIILRLANVSGKRNTHGVVFDFIKKLNENNKELEILGDGTQKKSFLFINDCIDAMMVAAKKHEGGVGFYNIGSEDMITVKDIAEIVCDEMQLKNVKFKFSGGVDGGRGWKGDVKIMQLSIDLMKSIGWVPEIGSAETVKATAKFLISGDNNEQIK